MKASRIRNESHSTNDSWAGRRDETVPCDSTPAAVRVVGGGGEALRACLAASALRYSLIGSRPQVRRKQSKLLAIIRVIRYNAKIGPTSRD
jgi:hypothetical protein